jgi:hypothetical protein
MNMAQIVGQDENAAAYEGFLIVRRTGKMPGRTTGVLVAPNGHVARPMGAACRCAGATIQENSANCRSLGLA